MSLHFNLQKSSRWRWERKNLQRIFSRMKKTPWEVCWWPPIGGIFVGHFNHLVVEKNNSPIEKRRWIFRCKFRGILLELFSRETIYRPEFARNNSPWADLTICSLQILSGHHEIAWALTISMHCWWLHNVWKTMRPICPSGKSSSEPNSRGRDSWGLLYLL